VREVRTADHADQLAPWLAERGARKVLLITGKSRRFVDEVTGALAGFEVQVFDGALVHVPESVVAAAVELVGQLEPDAIVSVGGGAATGLGKGIRLLRDIPFAAIPTTYSGSETTTIWGTSSGGAKNTGRDDRVRPDLVIYDLRFTPRRQVLGVPSLINALAHPISALSAGSTGAGGAIAACTDALLRLLDHPDSPRSRRAAIDAVIAAGAVLEAGELGRHHEIAHVLGGRFGASHAGLHSVLLAHSTFDLEPELSAAVHDAARVADLPGLIGEALIRVNAPRALRDLDVDGEPLAAMIDSGELPDWVWDAYLGLRPSRRFRRLERFLWSAGAPLERAARCVVALHGRDSDATAAIRQVRAAIADDPDTAILAPQAPAGSWYEEATAEELEGGLAAVSAAIDRAVEALGREQVFLHGLGQGACLAIAAIAARREALGGLIALGGARPPAVPEPVDLGGMPALLVPRPQRGDSPGAEHPPTGKASRSRIVGLRGEDTTQPGGGGASLVGQHAAVGAPGSDDVTAAELRAAGAAVEVLGVAGGEGLAARRIITGWSPADGPRGFGNSHEVEGLPGALARGQNSPRRVPRGLWAEQISGTGFVAERGRNLRSWLYRIRPATQHGEMKRSRQDRITGHFDARGLDPNLRGFRPLALPERPTDLIDGTVTLGGAGSAELRRGFAVHLYAATAGMERRAFANADGDLLVVPQLGTLTLLTELGVLEVGPGSVAVIPRGFKFSALLDGPARGWIGEVFGRNFELPDRGPVGANGLADERHFAAPSPHFEDRLDRGYRITTKLGGQLWEARQDYSPYDVVAWHGSYAPYRYDLSSFSPVGNTRFDHIDPSIHVVIGAPLDERGSSCLDFVFFAPRWDPTEHTLRPPWFHRNAITEINGIIRDPSLRRDGPFSEGCTFITPTLTAHGVLSRSLEAAIDGGDRPVRIPDSSAWFQFESALPLSLTSWARLEANQVPEWRGEWGAHRTHYDPHM
jgi:homogentisate 1,2-dioxygenase